MRKRHCEEQLSFIPKWPLLPMRPRIISVAEVVVVGVHLARKQWARTWDPADPGSFHWLLQPWLPHGGAG